MKIKFKAAMDESLSPLDSEYRNRIINLDELRPKKLSLIFDDEDGALYYVNIFTENPLFNTQYKFNNHLDALNFFNDICRYILAKDRKPKVSTSPSELFFYRARPVDADMPFIDTSAVKQKND